MITVEQIQDALNQVMDPELGRSIIDLGMVRDIVVKGQQVSFTFALTTLACPLQDNMVADAKAAIARLDENLQVQIRRVEMTQEEKQHLLGQPANEQEKPIAERMNDIKHVVAVMSGKGGVGKSSVAAQLAVALRRRGERVGVLDADITGPSIPKMFGLKKQPMMSPLGIVPPETKTGIKVMSINLLLQSEDQAVIWRGPLIAGAIRQFWSEVFWRDLDYLIIDLPPGTSDASLTVMQSIPVSGVLMVTSPQDLAGMVVRKAAQMAMQLNIPILGLVENMSYVLCPKCGERIDVFGRSKALETAIEIGVPLFGRLPIDPDFSGLCDAGQVEDYPAQAFVDIVEQIVAAMPKTKTKPVFE
ncbi:MAG: Mrp/NBP35 family ATP-binding protein [Anaerolineae bacterium]|nr:Mrp/NBP35 family ATP-binding protein [Anaerolineae bacterium]